MATINRTTTVSGAKQHLKGYPLGGVRFDLTAAFLGVWVLLGLYQDGWAHNHGFTDNSFFTPWHAILYSGVGAWGAFLIFHQYRSVAQGYAWAKALPRGYFLSLLGVILFFIAGAFDFLWHEAFGFEANVEILLSPAHLLLAGSGLLLVTGPIRAALHRREITAAPLSVMLSVFALLSMSSFFTQYANIFSLAGLFVRGNGVNEYWRDVTLLAHIFIPTAITMFFLLLLIRRWSLPFGAITLMLTVNALMMAWLQFDGMRQYLIVLLAAPAAGLLADVILRIGKPSLEHPAAMRVFGFTVPFALFGLALVLLNLSSGIRWTIHLWGGAPIIAGMIGLAMSYLSVPPQSAADDSI